jgi:hypothetical protein
VEPEQAQEIRIREPEAKPTGRQVYALAHELAKHAGVEFPRTRGAASELIERLRSSTERSSIEHPEAAEG